MSLDSFQQEKPNIWHLCGDTCMGHQIVGWLLPGHEHMEQLETGKGGGDLRKEFEGHGRVAGREDHWGLVWNLSP